MAPFEIPAVSLNHSVQVLGGAEDPSKSGVPAPVGSVYYSTNAFTYKKVGAGDRDWELEGFSGNTVALRNIIVTDSHTVARGVGLVAANHYYEDGITVTLRGPEYYKHPITVKNLSGNTVYIRTLTGHIEGRLGHVLQARMGAVTLEGLGKDWIITGEVAGVRMVPEHHARLLAQSASH